MKNERRSRLPVPFLALADRKSNQQPADLLAVVGNAGGNGTLRLAVRIVRTFVVVIDFKERKFIC